MIIGLFQRGVSVVHGDVIDIGEQLVTYGLINGAFRPVEQVCVLRSLWRQSAILQILRALTCWRSDY